MALPPRLWLPDVPLESPALALGLVSGRPLGPGPLRATLSALPTLLAGGWSGQGREVGAALPAASSGTTPRTLSPPTLDTPRVRRRALWRGEAGLPDRAVLVDWFPVSQLASEQAAASRVRGCQHAHLLSLIALGAADARTAYAISEASEGVDLSTVARAAPFELPPWWSVHVVACLCRGLLHLVEAQTRRRLAARGHGRINVSNIFLGWNGRVQLLSFAPAAGSSRHDESLAPELRLSERLLSPAADVYALATLLRQLLPAAVLARPGCSRLLRAALLRQAEQRLSLAALHSGLQALSLELSAPLSRVAAVGEVVARFCPPARVDLLETDWGESTGDGLAALPPSLAPFATAPVSLSPTWYRRPAPAAANRRLPFSAWLAVPLGLTALTLAGLWLSSPPSSGVATDRPTPSAPPLIAPAAKPEAAAPAGPPAVSERETAAVAPLLPPASLAGLRVAVSGLSWTQGGRPGETLARAQVRLSNPGHDVLHADLRELVLVGPGGVVLRPQPSPQLLGSSIIAVGPGRQVVRTLSFAPQVGDTAAARAAVPPPAAPASPPALPPLRPQP